MTPQTYTISVRRYDNGSLRFGFVVTPAPDGGDEFVSLGRHLKGHTAFRAGRVYLRDCERMKSGSGAGAFPKEWANLTYGEVALGIANGTLTMPKQPSNRHRRGPIRLG